MNLCSIYYFIMPWLKQKNWKTFSQKDTAHIIKCVSEIRHKRVRIADLAAESHWNPSFLITPYGLLRAGKLTNQIQDWVPFAPQGSIIVGTVVVLKRYRGQGHANTLMQELINRYGNHILALGVDPGNTPAIALYKKWGFRIVYRHPDDVGMLRVPVK